MLRCSLNIPNELKSRKIKHTVYVIHTVADKKILKTSPRRKNGKKNTEHLRDLNVDGNGRL
jgi:hypothetical protein